MLTKETLRTLPAAAPEAVPAFGGEILLGRMTAQQRGELERRFSNAQTIDAMALRIAGIHYSARQPDGSPLFANEKEAAAILSQLDGSEVIDLFEHVKRINRMGAKQQEDDAKN